MADTTDQTSDELKPLTFTEALEQKIDREAHGHGTQPAGEVGDDQELIATEKITHEHQETQSATENNDDHDRTTNIPR